MTTPTLGPVAAEVMYLLQVCSLIFDVPLALLDVTAEAVKDLGVVPVVLRVDAYDMLNVLEDAPSVKRALAKE